MQEEWKVIERFPNYQISNQGNVRNIKTGRILKPYLNGTQGKGYYRVRLSSGPNKKPQQVFVHKLVAEAFVPKNNESDIEVNHKDENKSNNKAENLEWCNHSYNARYGTAQARKSTTHYENKNKQIVKYSLDGEELGRFDTIVKAALSVEGNAGSLSLTLNDYGRNTYKGFIWKFEDKSE